MRSVLLCVVVLALVGGGLCGRRRRQAPPAGVIPETADGIPEGVIPEQDAPAAGAAAPANTKADGLNVALTVLISEANSKVEAGLPVDPKKMETILKLSLIIGLVGGEVSEPNQEGIANLLTATPPPAPAPAAPEAPAAPPAPVA